MRLRFSLLRPRSFRGQLALAVALLVAALAVSLSLALGALAARQGRIDEARSLHAIASNAARNLAEGLLVREREVRVLAASPTLWTDGLANERVHQVLLRSQAINPHSAWIGVTDAQGVVRNATGGLLVGVDVHERPWFGAGRRDVFVGDVHPAKLLAAHMPPSSDGGPQRFVDFAAPIVREGKLMGVIGIHGSWDWTRATVEALLPEDAATRGLEVFVFDRSGQPIYAPGRTLEALRQAGQRLPLRSAGVDQAGADTRASVVTWADGRPYLSSAVMLSARSSTSDLGWTVVVREPEDVAFAAARHIAALALALGLVAALAASVVGAALASRLTRPLHRMTAAARAVAEGATHMPLMAGNHEVESLSRTLATMTRGLVQAQAELAQRVAERTAELQRANAELAQLARHDPLTGLLNRRGLDERLADLLPAARRRAAPLALLLVDADHFKRVNDRFGHDLGDQVLQALADCLRQRLRVTDVLARVGGEEFVAVLPDCDGTAAAGLAAALVARMAELDLPQVGHVTISVGVAMVGAAGAAEALRRADAALYRAKQGGRNRFEMADEDIAEALPA